MRENKMNMDTLLEFLAQHPQLMELAIRELYFIIQIFRDHRNHYRGPELENNPPTVQAEESGDTISTTAHHKLNFWYSPPLTHRDPLRPHHEQHTR